MSDWRGVWSTLAAHWRLALTLRGLQIRFERDACLGSGKCIDVCPVGCWSMERDVRRAAFEHAERCIACGACVLQCPEGAIDLR